MPQPNPDSQLPEIRFLTVAEVAAYMRLSKMTIYRLIHNSDLVTIRVGRSFRVREDSVVAYMAEQVV